MSSNNATDGGANDPDRMQTSSPTPQPSAPGTPGTNGQANSPFGEERPPAPPIHRVPTNPPVPPVDAEACKAAGNKFFKARDYDKAVQEYSKGMSYSGIVLHKIKNRY
jgi:DnaJ family protein C protein 7